MGFLAANGRAFIECVRDLGVTALSITHDLASARKIAERIAMIYRGKIIWSGAVGEIDPADGEDAANRGSRAV